MKKRSLALTLFSLAVILLIVAFVTVYLLVLSAGEKNAPTDAPTTESTEGSTIKDPYELDYPELLTNISKSELHAFTVNGYRYLKGEDGYYAESTPDWPLEQAELQKIVDAITNLETTYRADTSNGGGQYGYYPSYDDPTFSLEDKNGGIVKIWIGERCDLDDRYYASSSVIDGVYLLSFDKSVLNYTPSPVLDSFYIFEEQDMLSFSVKDAQGKLLYYAPEEGGEPLSVWSFFGNMDISPSGVKAYRPTAAQLTEWGFDLGLRVQIDFVHYAGHTVNYEFAIGKAEDGLVYLRFDEIVYAIGTSAEGAKILSSFFN